MLTHLKRYLLLLLIVTFYPSNNKLFDQNTPCVLPHFSISIYSNFHFTPLPNPIILRYTKYRKRKRQKHKHNTVYNSKLVLFAFKIITQVTHSLFTSVSSHKPTAILLILLMFLPTTHADELEESSVSSLHLVPLLIAFAKGVSLQNRPLSHELVRHHKNNFTSLENHIATFLRKQISIFSKNDWSTLKRPASHPHPNAPTSKKSKPSNHPLSSLSHRQQTIQKEE